MSMFRYFPSNYVWSLAVNGALELGGKIGEIDEVCAPLREVATQGDDAGTEAFFFAWQKMAANLVTLAEEDEARGRLFSAGEKLQRAANYYQTAERMQAHGFAQRGQMYQQVLQCFSRAQALMQANCQRVEIPYLSQTGTAHIAGWFSQAANANPAQQGAAAPVVVCINGLDSTQEMLYLGPITRMFLRRGISVLCIDQPGTGEALRLHGMVATPQSEVWASKVVDYLEARASSQGDVDPRRIGLFGVSLGGYYTPRCVAFEPRFAAGAVWGANHNWAEMQKRRLQREGENPVPHYWEHVKWVFGAKDLDDFFVKSAGMHLNGVLDRIRVPFLVTHGEEDKQIPLEYAHQSYDQMVNSPARELKVFTAREGGVHHVSLDNMSNAGNYIADWMAEHLSGRIG
jgi:alpha-beta hydrolase superfamily lysophospholipase